MKHCIIDSCENRHHAKNYCKNHYMSFIRHNNPLASEQAVAKRTLRHVTNDGYILLHGYAKHPIASKKGAVMEHRLIIWNALKGADTYCHWCNQPIFWFDKPKLYVDHLDWNPANNNPVNLVESCNKCNSLRNKKSNDVIPKPNVDFHGTLKGYTYYKCRCDDCKSCMSQYQHNRKTKLQ